MMYFTYSWSILETIYISYSLNLKIDIFN